MRRNKFKTRRKFERLEDRRMMTGDVTYDEVNDEIIVTGTDEDDVVTVRFFAEEEDDVLVGKVEVQLGEGFLAPDKTELISDVKKITFNGGEDNDTLTVSIEQLPAGVTVSGVALVFNGGDGDDELIQNDGGIPTTANGGTGDDKLQGSRFNDVLDGGADSDTYKFSGPSLGTDEVHEVANVDTDTLDFSEYEHGVFVNLDRVFVPNANTPSSAYAVWTFGHGQVKLFSPTGIEDVVGTAHDDSIQGNSRPNYFKGGGDDDTLEGRGGNDILEGEGGSDIYEFSGTNLGTDDIEEAADSDNDGLRFSGMSAGVNVDISKAGSDFAVNSSALRLRLATDTAIERVWGSHYGDTITGNSRNNTLKGLGGNDTIVGGIGADILDGGADMDTFKATDALDQVFGGTGRDTFDGIFETFFSTPPRARYLDWGTF